MVRGLPPDAASKLHIAAASEGAVLILYALTLNPPRAVFSEIDEEIIQYWLDRGVYPVGLIQVNDGLVELKALELNLPELPAGAGLRALVRSLLHDISAQVWALTQRKAA